MIMRLNIDISGVFGETRLVEAKQRLHRVPTPTYHLPNLITSRYPAPSLGDYVITEGADDGHVMILNGKPVVSALFHR